MHDLDTQNSDLAFSSHWRGLLPISVSAQVIICDKLWKSLLQAIRVTKGLMIFKTILKEKDETHWIYSLERLLNKTMGCAWLGTLPHTWTIHMFSCPLLSINSYSEDSSTSKLTAIPTAPYTTNTLNVSIGSWTSSSSDNSYREVSKACFCSTQQILALQNQIKI